MAERVADGIENPADTLAEHGYNGNPNDTENHQVDDEAGSPEYVTKSASVANVSLVVDKDPATKRVQHVVVTNNLVASVTMDLSMNDMVTNPKASLVILDEVLPLQKGSLSDILEKVITPNSI
ncbi:hypothetical protein ACH5RR_008469 [Cinchona calisaya]|uniref:Uncharacterized protein n=1 Tax=Cinchona calisaya TaxID=153742 RepID=A0ABD3AED5_9GENT